MSYDPISNYLGRGWPDEPDDGLQEVFMAHERGRNVASSLSHSLINPDVDSTSDRFDKQSGRLVVSGDQPTGQPDFVPRWDGEGHRVVDGVRPAANDNIPSPPIQSSPVGSAPWVLPAIIGALVILMLMR